VVKYDIISGNFSFHFMRLVSDLSPVLAGIFSHASCDPLLGPFSSWLHSATSRGFQRSRRSSHDFHENHSPKSSKVARIVFVFEWQMLIRCPSRRSAAVICTAADRWNGPLGNRIPVSPLMASDHHLIDIHLFMPDDHASMRKGGRNMAESGKR